MKQSIRLAAASILASAVLTTSPTPLEAQEPPPAGTQAPPTGTDSPEQSIARIQEILAQEPENATGQLSLGTLLFQQGRFPEARLHLEKAAQLAPNSVEAHATLAIVLEQLNELEAAEQQYSQALKILPDNADIRVRRAALRNRLDKREEALEDLDHALQINPGIIQAIFGKGILLHAMGRSEEAIVTIRTVDSQTDEPNARAQAHMQIGQWLGEAGQADQAIAELQQALELQPNLEAAQLALANLTADSERYGEAAEQFAKIVASSPDNKSARFGLAVALLMTERYPAALASIADSIARYPDWVAMEHVLARLLAACPDDAVRNGQRALELATEVMNAHPGLQSVQTYAMALAENGRFEEAATVQRDVIRRFEEAGADDRLEIFRRRLASYEQGRPVRSPWLDAKRGGGF